MAKVTDLQEYKDRRAGIDPLTELLTNPAARKKVGSVLGIAAMAAIGIGYMAQSETRVLSTTGSETKDHQIVSVTAEHQLEQAIADAAGKAPADKLKVLQNGNNLVTIQEAIVGSNGKPLAKSVINPDTKQIEPVVEITNTTSRFDSLFSPEKIGELGVQALPVNPSTGQPAQR